MLRSANAAVRGRIATTGLNIHTLNNLRQGLTRNLLLGRAHTVLEGTVKLIIIYKYIYVRTVIEK